MWPFRLYSVVLSAVLLIPVGAHSQTIPVDTAMVFLEEARHLHSTGETGDAEYLLQLLRRRYPNSEAARLAGRMLENMQAGKGDGDGNTELIVFSTFYGASLGMLVPAAFGAEEPEPYGAGILLGAPAGYGASRLYTNSYPVTTGQARAMTFGTWWGALQGLGWREVLDIGDETQTFCYDSGDGITCFDVTTGSDEAPYIATIVGGAVGLATGTILARSLKISGSTALITNFSAIWGSWYGAVLGVQIDPTHDDEFSDNDDDTVVATMLIGGNAGVLAGALAGPSLNWSSGDAWAVHLSGIVGLIGGLGIDLLASVETTETGLLIPGLTSAAALGVAGVLVSGRKKTASRSSGARQSFVNYASGSWQLGTPLPMPTRVRVYGDGQRRHEIGATVSLLRMAW